MNDEKKPRFNPAGVFDHSGIKRKFLDVPYAALSPAQRLDIYLPDAGGGAFPVIVHIHGGAFMMCDKTDEQVRPFARGVERGYAVVSVNYRLSGEAIFPAGLQDVKAAIRFLRANAAKFSLDPARFAAVGGSSGGNFACMVSATAGRAEFEDAALGNAGFSSAVQAGVAWFPPTDFLLMDAQLAENALFPQDHSEAASPESRYMGGQITALDAQYVQKANPASYVSNAIPPMLIQHGRRDHLVPWQQSKLFVDKIRAVCGDARVRYDVFETADHGDPQFETDANMKKVFDFLDEVLKK